MSRTGRRYCYSGARAHLPLSWVCIEVIYKCLDISWIYINNQDRSAILLQRSSSPFAAQLDISWIYINNQDRSAILLQRSSSPFAAQLGRRYCYSGARAHLPLSWVCIEVIYKCLDISWIYINVQDRSAILLQRSSSPFAAQLGRRYCYSGARAHLPLSWVCIEVIYKCLDISWIYINNQDRSAILLQRSSSPFATQLGRRYCYSGARAHLPLSWVCIEVVYECLDISWIYINNQDRSAILLQWSSSPFAVQLGRRNCYSGARPHLPLSWVCIEVVYECLDISWIYINNQDRSAILLQRSSSPFAAQLGRRYCYSGARAHLPLSWVCIEVVYKCLDISWIYINNQDRSAILLQRSSSPFAAQLGRRYCYSGARPHLPLSWVCIEVVYECLDISWIYINNQDRSAILLQRSSSPFAAQLGRRYCYSGARAHLPLSWVCIEVVYECLDISWIYINNQDRSAILLQRSSSPFAAQLGMY
ncbi:hypothetical protein J6590_098270 [Homalodisca vitripennis]|nr:hypothetical protein J6590_098270 [Homalodisca vitripennis]